MKKHNLNTIQTLENWGTFDIAKDKALARS
jgi:hypothetical protein